jgi:hypothetical protein
MSEQKYGHRAQACRQGCSNSSQHQDDCLGHADKLAAAALALARAEFHDPSAHARRRIVAFFGAHLKSDRHAH